MVADIGAGHDEPAKLQLAGWPLRPPPARRTFREAPLLLALRRKLLDTQCAIPHVRVAGHVIFTSDGQSAVSDDVRRLHRMRRSFCKSWRNDKWRDLLLAFWHWLSAGESVVEVSLGEAAALKLRLPPIAWDASFGIETASDRAFEGVDAEDEEEEEEDENILDDEATDEDEEEQDTGEDP